MIIIIIIIRVPFSNNFLSSGLTFSTLNISSSRNSTIIAVPLTETEKLGKVDQVSTKDKLKGFPNLLYNKM
jgi:hypothetical protein